MAKNKVFKKITALAMAIALVVCFAVSASAINVATTTTYVNNNEDIAVNVAVTGIAAGVNVTYYATDAQGNEIHIDQVKATDAGAVFDEFYTAATNLNSNVKIGYTGAGAAQNEKITGYTISYPGGSKLIPTATTTINFAYRVPEGKVVAAVNPVYVVTEEGEEAAAEIASSTYAEGNVSVTFASLSGDVTLDVALEDATPGEVTAEAAFIDAGAVVSTGSVDKVVTGGREDEKGNYVNGTESEDADVNAAEGNRKLTVIGQVNVTAGYGIVVSNAAITSGTYSQAEFDEMTSYAGATQSTNGLFAVQLIDTSAADSDDAFIEVGVDYYVAIYASNGDGRYVIEAKADAIQANAVQAN